MRHRYQKRRMRGLVLIGQRWRRKGDGQVVVLRQVWRADDLAQAEYERPRFDVDFHDLARDYELDQGRTQEPLR